MLRMIISHPMPQAHTQGNAPTRERWPSAAHCHRRGSRTVHAYANTSKRALPPLSSDHTPFLVKPNTAAVGTSGALTLPFKSQTCPDQTPCRAETYSPSAQISGLRHKGPRALVLNAEYRSGTPGALRILSRLLPTPTTI